MLLSLRKNGLTSLFKEVRVFKDSEASGPTQFQEKRSRSEKAIPGALGAFQGILGAALGVKRIILGMRNPILGTAPRDLCNAKATILGATPGAIPGIDGNPHGRISFGHAFSERFFKNWGCPRAPETWPTSCCHWFVLFLRCCTPQSDPVRVRKLHRCS